MKKIALLLLTTFLLMSCGDITEMRMYLNIGDYPINYPQWFETGRYASEDNDETYLQFDKDVFYYEVKNITGIIPQTENKFFFARKVLIEKMPDEEQFKLSLQTVNTLLRFTVTRLTDPEGIRVEKYIKQSDYYGEEDWGNFYLE